MDDIWVVMCSFADRDEARQIGTHLVEKQYAACVNILPGVESVYSWQGKLCQEQEVMALIKTRKELFDDLCKELLSMHSYDEPEVLALPVKGGSPGYLKWLTGQLG